MVNISISVLLLLLAMYIPNALHLASFPSLLLVTTLFRLSLNVSSTRLILLTAQPGDVIKAFGNFVVQGNLVVGIVIFALGTSLPELTAGIASARKGHTEIGLGNIVGSNVFNTLAVVGISGLVAPFQASGAEDDRWPEAVGNALQRDLPVNAAFALMLAFGPFLFRGRFARQRAAFLLVAWLTYVVAIAP